MWSSATNAESLHDLSFNTVPRAQEMMTSYLNFSGLTLDEFIEFNKSCKSPKVGWLPGLVSV